MMRITAISVLGHAAATTIRRGINWLRVVVLLGGIATAFAAHADVECRPLKQVVKESSEAGYTGFIYANEIAGEDDGTVNGIATRSAGASRVRKKLESMVEMSLDAGTFAEQAVASGVIESGAEEQFVAQIRQRLHASLMRNHANAAWLMLMVNPLTRKGIVLVRKYEFPRDGRAGVMNGSDQVCVRGRLEQVTRWSAEQPATTPALLGGREQPDCGFAAGAGVICAGLSGQLEQAATDDESVLATARTGSVLWVYTLNPWTGRGRVLHVEPNGTALLDTWLFKVNAP